MIYTIDQKSNHSRKELFSRKLFDFSQMENFSVDSKVMPKGFDDSTCLLVATSEITDFSLAMLIVTGAVQVIAKYLFIDLYDLVSKGSKFFSGERNMMCC